MLNTITAVAGVVVSLFVGLLTYLASHRRNVAQRATGDAEARDRLIDQLQERITQLTNDLTASEAAEDSTREHLVSARNELDSLQRHHRQALAQLEDSNARNAVLEARLRPPEEKG